MAESTPHSPASVVRRLERPDEKLLVSYAVRSLLLGPFFPFLLVPLYFRYRTLRYRFGDEGVSMRWGALFHREVHLDYERIQDIHLSSHVVERWLGLARIEVQTASGSSEAEMVIEGLPEFEAVRDFLYERMRGVRDRKAEATQRDAGEAAAATDPAGGAELARLLGEVTAELRAVRESLEAREREPAGAPARREDA